MTDILKLKNNSTGNLSASITDVDTSISLMPGDGGRFPSIAPGQYFPITIIKLDGTYEIAHCTARSSDILTVTRGQDGTTAISFSALDRVEHRLTAGALQGEFDRLIASSVSLVMLALSTGASLVGFIQSGVGAVLRTVQNRLRETVSVMDFGAVGTANAGNVTLDTAAFLAAMATGKNVYVPQGTYYVSTTIPVGAGQCLWGAGRGKTIIRYTGANYGIYCGAPGDIQLIYDISLRDFTLFCTSLTTRVAHGIFLENCVYFDLDGLGVYGPGLPNSAVPAERVLTGNGIYLTNNSILGRISNCSARLWNFGYYLKTLPGSASFWTAAIVIDGGAEVANNMFGIVIGDPAISHASGVGVSIRDVYPQGNYSGGMLINSGESTTIDACYFEGNGNYDVQIGTTLGALPAMCRVINCIMTSENLSGSPYGAAPYTAKIKLINGSFHEIHSNDISISTAIPLVTVAAGCQYARITANRLNSIIAAGARITNAGLYTRIDGNYPNQVPNCFVGTFTRAADGPTEIVAYNVLPFLPSSMEFSASIDGAIQNSYGWTDGVTARCVTVDGSNFCQNAPQVIKIIRPTVADTVTAQIVNFSDGGFVLSWELNGTPTANTMVINYIAWR